MNQLNHLGFLKEVPSNKEGEIRLRFREDDIDGECACSCSHLKEHGEFSRIYRRSQKINPNVSSRFNIYA